MPEPRHLRTVRSFACRQGRLTKGQSRALEILWPSIGLDPNKKITDLDEVFGRAAKRILEIGFGMGETLAEMALTNPEIDFIGIEVHRPGIGHLLTLIEKHSLSNIRIYYFDAVKTIQHCLPDNSLQGVQVYFPDPWHKTRHHKRRLIQEGFVTLLTNKLQPGGYIHLATDWQDYATHMLAVLQQIPQLNNTAENNSYIPRPESRTATKYEGRGKRLGHDVWDILFLKRQSL